MITPHRGTVIAAVETASVFSSDEVSSEAGQMISSSDFILAQMVIEPSTSHPEGNKNFLMADAIRRSFQEASTSWAVVQEISVFTQAGLAVLSGVGNVGFNRVAVAALPILIRIPQGCCRIPMLGHGNIIFHGFGHTVPKQHMRTVVTSCRCRFYAHRNSIIETE